METSEAAWVRFEQVGDLSAHVVVLDAERRPIESYVPPVTHSVNGQALRFDIVDPWLAMNGLEAVGEWTHEDGAFISRVRTVAR